MTLTKTGHESELKSDPKFLKLQFQKPKMTIYSLSQPKSNHKQTEENLENTSFE